MDTTICKTDECKEPVYVKKSQLCATHYHRHRRLVKKLESGWSPPVVDSNGNRKCPKCSRYLPESSFTVKWKNRTATRTSCGQCMSLKYTCQRMNISVEKFHDMLKEQKFTCAICPEPIFTSGRFPSIDHDHSCCAGLESCGQCVRGLLCHRCNTGIGMFKDDLNSLHSAISYLEKYSID